MKQDRPLIIALENVRDAIALRDCYKAMTGTDLQKFEFGHLHWKINVKNMQIRDIDELIDQINLLNDNIYVFMETDFTIEFDYYINATAVPIIRAIIDEHLLFLSIIYWEFEDF